LNAVTCSSGYIATGSGSLLACLACASSSLSNYASCTINSITPGTVSAVVCASGFYLSAANTCSSCATNTALMAGDG
jgi:hypothetical protein